MELFTATGKVKKCFFLTTRDVRCVHHGDTAHSDTIFKFLPHIHTHTHIHTHIHTHPHTHTHTHIHTHTYTHTPHIHTHTYTHTPHIHTHTVRMGAQALTHA